MTELAALNIKITGDAGDLKAAVSTATAELGKVQAAAATVPRGFNAAAASGGNLAYTMRGVSQQLSQVGQQTMATGQFVQALAIQLPDIGVAFGAVGAAAGLLAGIALPMLVSALYGGESASRTFADAITQADDALTNTAALAKIAAGDFSALAEQYGALTEQVLALYQADLQAGLRELADGASALKDELLEMYNGNAWANVSRAEDLANGLRLGTKASGELAAAMNVLRDAGSLDDQLAIVSLMRTRFEEMVGPVGQMTKSQFDFWLALKDSESKMLMVKQRTTELKTEVFGIVSAASAAAGAIGSIGTAATNALPAVSSLATKLWDAVKAQGAATAAQAKAVGGGRGIGPQGPELDPYGFRNQLKPNGVGSTDGGTGGVGGTGGAGGGANPLAAELEAMQTAMMTQEMAQIESYTRQQETLVAALDQRLITQEEYAAMMQSAELSHANKMAMIKQSESDMVRQASSAMYGSLEGLLQVFAGKSKAAAIASIALNKGLAIASIIQNTAAAQMKAMFELGPIAGPAAAAKIGMMGKIQAGIVAATGLAQAAGAGGGGGGRAGSVAGSAMGGGGATEMRTANINFYGGFQPTQETIGMIASGLNDWLGDGGRLNMGGA